MMKTGKTSSVTSNKILRCKDKVLTSWSCNFLY